MKRARTSQPNTGSKAFLWMAGTTTGRVRTQTVRMQTVHTTAGVPPTTKSSFAAMLVTNTVVSDKKKQEIPLQPASGLRTVEQLVADQGKKRNNNHRLQALVNAANEAMFQVVRAEEPIFDKPTLCSIKVVPESASDYVDAAWVADFVKSLPTARPGSSVCSIFEEVLQKEIGKLFASARIGDDARGLSFNVTSKLTHIHNAFDALSKTPCQDPRAAPNRMIISLDIFEDEHGGKVDNIMRCGRGFTVNDPLAFNLVLRAMQSNHASYPVWKAGRKARGTKGMTDVLRLVGIGPPKGATGHRAANFRGPKTTDPDKKHPDGDRTDGKRETDGLYFRRYDYNKKRILSAVHSKKFFKQSKKDKKSK